MSTDQIDELFDELVRLQTELDSATAMDTDTLLGTYSRQARISAELRESGGLTQDEIAARLYVQLRH